MGAAAPTVFVQTIVYSVFSPLAERWFEGTFNNCNQSAASPTLRNLFEDGV